MKSDPKGFNFPVSAKYMCEVCNKIVATNKSFVDHIEIHRAIIDEEILDLMKRRISLAGRYVFIAYFKYLLSWVFLCRSNFKWLFLVTFEASVIFWGSLG